MREAAFVKKNQKRWKRFEQLLGANESKASPDQLSELFIYLTDDLSYARTFYPQSKTTAYLNHLAVQVHQTIYKNKKEKDSRFITFWKNEVPEIVYKNKRPLLYSLVIFLVSALIGVVSSIHDDTFVRLILGDGYVNMTIENIEKNDPMAVYKDAGQMDMFSMITLNNIRVSFNVFATGILASVGSILMLMYNGIMVGAFQYFFYEYGLLFDSFITIWIHGTIEISSIVIAGGAGMVMGNSMLFPGTYSRMLSLKRGTKDGLKIIIGLIPLFIFAGFLEGFVTRYTELPTIAKLSIIGVSAIFIIYYFILYPFYLNKIQILKNTSE